MTTRMVSRSLPLALVVGLALVTGCERPKELRVPLDYRPTDRMKLGGLDVVPGVRLAVSVVDARADTAAIGQNAEGSPPVPIYAGGPSPDVFVRDGVARELANAGIPVESDPHAANKGLTLRLQRFWTDETSTYKTSILASAELTDASGRSLWRGQVTGNNKRFGRSLKAENYQETLSDAVVDLVQNMLHDPAFGQALNAPPARAPAVRKSGRG